jgi:HEAT repeat protein
VARLLDALQNGESAVRRSARTELAGLGPSAVPQMMQALRRDGAIYRTRLGVLVALNEMIPEDSKGKRQVGEAVAAVLDEPKDWIALAKAIDVEDRTQRQYATELLYDLDDGKKATPLLDVAKQTERPEARYQVVFALGNALERLEGDARAAAVTDLRALCSDGPTTGPNTKRLIDRRLKEANEVGCPP